MLKLFLKYSPILLIFVALKLSEVKVQSERDVSYGWGQIVALGASVLGSVLQGASQRRQARQLEAQNQRPVYQPSPEIRQNQAIAQQMASVGLPNQVYNNQLNLIQQNMATGLRQIGQRGNTAVNANAIVRGANQAVQNLNAADAQARQQWTQALMNTNSALANEQRNIYQDQANQWMFNAQNIASQRRAGTQNIFGGLGMLAQGAMMGVFNGSGGSTGINRNMVNPNTLQPVNTVGVSGLTNQGFNFPNTLPFRQYM